MNCAGIFVDAYTQNKIFNLDLVITQGQHLVANHFVDDPEQMRRIVEQKVRQTHPHLNVQFLDYNSEQEITVEQIREIGEYSLLICADAPIFSGRMH